MSSNGNDIAVVSRDREKTIVRTSVVGIILTGIGVYSYNTSDDEAAQMRNAIQKRVLSHDWALQMHGFYADTEKKTIRFDVVVSFDADRKEAMETLYGEIGAMYPEYTAVIVPDADVAD